MQKSAQAIMNYNKVPMEIIKIYISIKEMVKTYDNQVKHEKLCLFNNCLTYEQCSDTLTPEFMQANKINPYYRVAIMHGKDFDANMVGFNDHVPSSKDFLFFNIKTNTMPEKKFRLF